MKLRQPFSERVLKPTLRQLYGLGRYLTPATSISKLHEKPWDSEIRANAFFPYNLFYYGSVTILSALYSWARRHRRSKSNMRIRAAEPESEAGL